MKYSRIPDIVSYGDGVSVGVVFMCRDNAETNRKCVESYVNNLSNSIGKIQYVLCYGSDKIDIALDSVPVEAQDKVWIREYSGDSQVESFCRSISTLFYDVPVVMFVDCLTILSNKFDLAQILSELNENRDAIAFLYTPGDTCKSRIVKNEDLQLVFDSEADDSILQENDVFLFHRSIIKSDKLAYEENDTISSFLKRLSGYSGRPKNTVVSIHTATAPTTLSSGQHIVSDHPFFRIITPTYNSSSRLVRLFKSLAKQTFTDFVWVVVDDASTDNTYDTMVNMAFDNPWIVYRRNQNRTYAGGARNTALEISKELNSTYTMYIDADDVVPDKEALDKLHNFILEKNCPDLICLKATSAGKILKYACETFNDVARGRLEPWCKCHKSELSVPFVPNRRKWNDVIWNYRLLDNVDTFAMFDRPVVDYSVDWRESAIHGSREVLHAPETEASVYYLAGDLLSESFMKQEVRDAAMGWFNRKLGWIQRRIKAMKNKGPAKAASKEKAGVTGKSFFVSSPQPTIHRIG